MRTYTRIMLVGLTLLLLQRCSSKNDYLDGLDLDGEIQRIMETDRIPSVAACVIKDDEIVWQSAYGFANRETGTRATTETLYPVMSIAKLVIVTAAMQLVERGLLDLDADVSRYLPFEVRSAYPEYSDKTVTAKMLLTHISAITNPPGFFEDFPYDGAPPLREWLTEYFETPDHTSLWLRHAPGEAYSYSNTGSALMAFIVEVISGMDYNEYCKENIFLPLDMPNTSHRFADLDEERIAYPYGYSYDPFTFYYTHRDYPAGFLMSSLEDFSHFLMAYNGGGEYNGHRILDQSTVEEILTQRNSDNGLCLEWFRFPCPKDGGRMLCFRTEDDWYGHNGGDDAGYSTHAAIQTEDRLGIIILSNSAVIENSSVFPGGSLYELVYRKANEFR